MKKIFLLFLFAATQLISNDFIWESPITLSTSMVDASEPQIAMDASGNTTAVWVESTFIKARTLPAMGSWSAVATLSSSGSSSPRIAVDSAGNVVAVWLDSGVVKTATKAVGGAWGSETSLSSSSASQPALALRANGDVVVVWTRGGFIESKTKLSAGAWGSLNTISEANSDNPDVAVGDNGTVIAIWHTVSSGSDIVRSSSKTIGGAWTTPKSLVQLSVAFKMNYPKVVVDVGGNATAIAFRYQDYGGESINVSLYGSVLPLNAAAWLAIPIKLSGSGICDPADLVAKISCDSVGNVLAMWTITYDGSIYAIEVAQKLIGSDWSSTVQLVKKNLYAFGVDLAANSLSDVVGLYTLYEGDSLVIRALESNISGINSDVLCSTPITISNNSGNILPKIASVFLDPDILAAAAWLSYDGANTILQAANGSRTTLDPPSNLAVTQDVVDFGVYADYVNTITWDASSSPNVVEYEIFRNGIFFKRVSANNPLEITEHNVNPMETITYGIACIDDDLTQSVAATIQFP